MPEYFTIETPGDIVDAFNSLFEMHVVRITHNDVHVHDAFNSLFEMPCQPKLLHAPTS